MKNNYQRAAYISVFFGLLAFGFYGVAVLSIDFFSTRFLNLGPYPDGIEYFSAALNILHDNSYTIQVGTEHYPPRYPFGYSLFMLPALMLLPPAQAILAPFLTNQIVGLFMLCGFFVYYFSQRRFLAAGLSVLLIASCPSFISFARSPLSEISSVALIVLAHSFVVSGIKREKVLPFIIGAFIFGLAILVRTQFIFFGPLLLSPFLLKKKGWSYKLLLTFGSGLVYLLAALPLFLYNWKVFGHPLQTGYHFWVPGSLHNAFSPENISGHFDSIWKAFTMQEEAFRVANLFGPGVYFTVFFIILFSVSFFYILFKKRTVLPYTFPSLTFCLVTIFYFFNDVRFYFPVIVMSIPLIVIFVEDIFQGPLRENFFTKTVVSVLMAFVFVGFPAQAGFPPKKIPSLTLALTQKGYLGDISVNYLVFDLFLKIYDGNKSLVLTSINPVYCNSLLPKEAVCIPGDKNHHYVHSEKFKFGTQEIEDYINRSKNNNERIYFLAPVGVSLENLTLDSITQENSSWRKLSSAGVNGTIYELIYTVP